MNIEQLRQKYIDGSYTPLEAVEEAFRVIKEKDGDINAFLETYDDAIEEAKVATDKYKEMGSDAPALLGVPIAIKNNILIRGKKATAASKMLENYVASYDATIIKKLREAGAIFVGSTNMDEFAMGSSTENSAFGPTKNPLDTSRVPGGTSGGSAASVAMGAVPVAIGTDTGGSIRQPASFCGVVGYKPTYGAVSRYGIIPMGSSFDQAGGMAHTVSDVELIHSVISGHDQSDMTTIKSDTYPEVVKKDKYTFGVPRDFLGEGIDTDVMEKFEKHLEKLRADGHEVVDIELPLFEKGLAAYYISIPAEVSSNLARFDGIRYGLSEDGENLMAVYENSRAKGFGEEVKRRILLGTYVLSAGYYDAFYRKAEMVRELMRQELNKVFKEVDAVVLPTAPSPAFKIGEHSDPMSLYKQDIFTVPVNLTGVPAISVPYDSVQREGTTLPLGVQYIAPHGGDERLFDIGKKVYDSKQ